MGKNQTFILLKKQVRTAEGWLRLLWESPLPNLPHVGYCPRCDRPKMSGALVTVEDISRCGACGEFVKVLDKSFFAALSKFLKYSHRKDRSLFARVKAGMPEPFVYDKTKPPSLAFPTLEGNLSWVTRAWENACKPRGGSRKTRLHLFIGSWIDSLVAPRVVFEVTEKGPPSIHLIKPLMSFVDAIEVLQGNYPPVGHTLYTTSGRKRTFGGLDSETLHQIHEEFTAMAVKDFRIVPLLELRESRRIHQWYNRWRSAKHRIQGNRVREDNPA